MSLPHAKVCMPLPGADAAQPAHEAGPFASMQFPADDGPCTWWIQDEGFADIDTGADVSLPAQERTLARTTWCRQARILGSRRVSAPRRRWVCSASAT